MSKNFGDASSDTSLKIAEMLSIMPKITELFLISVKSLKVSRNIFFGFAR
jgi:hypothetical protein